MMTDLEREIEQEFQRLLQVARQRGDSDALMQAADEIVKLRRQIQVRFLPHPGLEGLKKLWIE